MYIYHELQKENNCSFYIQFISVDKHILANTYVYHVLQKENTKQEMHKLS